MAAAFALFFGVLNLFGARKTGRMQLVLLIGLLAILSWFILHGFTQIERSHFQGFFDAGFDAIFSTAGLVYISYVGLTKVASVSEEVKNPERNLPLGVFLGLATAVLIYALGTFVMVGTVPAGELAGRLTVVAVVAERLVGRWGVVLSAVAAMLAFWSVANAGILSASRYPLAMSRDHLLPRAFSALGRRGMPTVSIVFTVAAVLVVLLTLDPTRIAKLASAFQRLMFGVLSFAVIAMRESGIASYDPGYRSPAYPWMQIFGIVASLWLITEMGWIPVLFTASMVGLGVGWYFYYARAHIARQGAVFHVFERLGRQRFEGLDRELRSILKEKGVREADAFDQIVARASVLDLVGHPTFEDIVAKASALLAQRLPCTAQHLADGFLNGTRIGATPVEGGMALPHLRLRGSSAPEMVLVRCRRGVHIDAVDVFGDTQTSESIFALFFLVSPDHDAGQHLRILAQVAEQVEQDGFLAAWMDAGDESELTGVLLRDERSLSLTVQEGTPTERLAGKALRELFFPEGCLVALVRRKGQTIVPRGSTVLEENDRLTIIGSHEGIRSLRADYAAGT